MRSSGFQKSGNAVRIEAPFVREMLVQLRSQWFEQGIVGPDLPSIQIPCGNRFAFE